ncbi:hypothetical protein FM120_20905 [Sphingobacterium faecium PCAi_F2.5]|nr:hypothetical protein FM120_20905 [Sphingobacterium faecium PCAi_F2.5]
MIIIEIVIGGSGRLVEFGSLSLKMVFFLIAMLISFFSLNRVDSKEISNLQIVFLLVLLLGFCLAAFNNAQIEFLIEDIKPLLFMFMINYFAINIKSLKNIQFVSSLIKWSSLFMAIIYLLIVFGLYVGVIDFSKFYQQQSEGSEIFFRGELFFFYKGFLYLGVGFFFLVLSDRKIDQIFALILFAALCLTLTRGFILAASLIYLYHIFFVNKSFLLKIFILFFVLGAIIYLLPLLFDTLGNKSESDLVRVVTINQVLDQMSFFSFFFGHGFGNGVQIRPVHMEISFLEIFHKQGVLGLFFWSYLLYMVFNNYKKIETSQFKHIAMPFTLSVVFVYIQSFTNPFVNNPIGISIIIITIVVLVRLRQMEYLLKK